MTSLSSENVPIIVTSEGVPNDEKSNANSDVANHKHHTDLVRNFSIVGHVDHGKTVMTDSILQRGGLISKVSAGTARTTDNRKDEIERGITIKSTGVSLQIDNLQINLIDSPGHADFNSEVTAALRISDGCLILIDAVEGISCQSETVLRQALVEQVTPILFINKFDRYLFELNLLNEVDAETVYNKMNNIIASVNAIIQTYKTDDEFSLSPEKGNVFFSCGLHNWGFSLKHFAKLYSKKYNISEEKLMTYLWGDYFINPATKKITTDRSVPGAVRVFNKLVYEPIQELFTSMRDAGTPINGVPRTAIQELAVAKYMKVMKTLDITLTKAEMQLTEKALFKATMQQFVPLADALLDGIRNHLPSPVQAQKYRVSTIYDGPMDDDVAKAIRTCDKDGPVMMYITKNVPSSDNSRFYALGRLFSGTLKNGQKVTILGSNYAHGKKLDMYVDKTIQGISIMQGKTIISQNVVECGGIVALSGIDAFFTKSATVTSIRDEPYPIKTMKFAVSPIVQVAIKCKNTSDLPKLAVGIKKLIKSDPCVVNYMSANNEQIIAGAGELHLEICLNDLREFMNGAEIIASKPIVPFRESISIESKECLAKSSNSHNRLFMIATPLSEDVIKDLEAKNFDFKDMLGVCRKLVNDHGWQRDEARKIWSFGPTNDEANMLVDGTKGNSYLADVKDSIIAGFQKVCMGGPLLEEPLRGVKFTILDAKLHQDSIHRSSTQILPMSTRVMTACVLTGEPKLVEPYYKLTVSVPDVMVSKVYSSVGYKGGRITDEVRVEGTQTKLLTGILPVLSSFGFDSYIREQTSGMAFPSCVFSHWDVMSGGDPLDEDSKVHKLITDNRASKGINVDIPPLDRFLDKL